MYLVGFIKTDAPEVLINPVLCDGIDDLYLWLTNFFNEKDYKLDLPLTRQSLETALQADKPIRVNINGYKVALLLGEENIIQNVTERYVHADLGNI
ncbi:hypothetical protein [Adhaeribacter aquaticus]|uniref:hypothetical protein n=1 Tax=Adhaeribacter aquaticus TaxID=299567 RepID=UPI0003FD33FD|nr:hypothetical protein [Adhaeribacter aquaticus]